MNTTFPPPAIIELRQYTLHPGARDTLIELFEREFVETQEAAGMQVLGQFRDLDHPDRFVWLRGFPDMQARQRALQSFYGGPVWAAHRDAANATMVDSDNVLLLRPAWPGAGLAPGARAPVGATAAPRGLLDATLFYLKQPASPEVADLAQGPLSRVLTQGGARSLGWYVSESAPNDFPRLPVREGEHVLLALALFDDAASFDSFAASGAWQREAAPLLAPLLARPPEPHRLAPTARSAIHA